jgi:purine-binding chemotaxis protein CheW
MKRTQLAVQNERDIDNKNNASSNDTDDADQYLTFKLSDEMYAFDILNVKEILEYGNITKVPMMPDFIQGVINLRGEVVPVINLSRRFSFEKNQITKRTCIVIIEILTEYHHQDVGVMVDSVSEVLEIKPEDMRATPGFGARIRTDFIRSMGKIGEDFVIILAEDKVLSVDELSMMNDIKDIASNVNSDRS